jgi:hypothetical protein
MNVVRRLVEGRLPKLVVAGVTEHHEVPHALATLVCFPGRRAEAGFPPDLRHSGPQLVAEWAALRLVIEQRYRQKMIMPRPAIFSLRPMQACSINVGCKRPQLPVSCTRRMSCPRAGGAISASEPADCS